MGKISTKTKNKPSPYKVALEPAFGIRLQIVHFAHKNKNARLSNRTSTTSPSATCFVSITKRTTSWLRIAIFNFRKLTKAAIVALKSETHAARAL
jgi:hypothetical protein